MQYLNPPNGPGSVRGQRKTQETRIRLSAEQLAGSKRRGGKTRTLKAQTGRLKEWELREGRGPSPRNREIVPAREPLNQAARGQSAISKKAARVKSPTGQALGDAIRRGPITAINKKASIEPNYVNLKKTETDAIG